MKPSLENMLSMCTGFALCGVIFYAILVYSDIVETVTIDITKEIVCTDRGESNAYYTLLRYNNPGYGLNGNRDVPPQP
jgi:hypothetical protein